MPLYVIMAEDWGKEEEEGDLELEVSVEVQMSKVLPRSSKKLGGGPILACVKLPSNKRDSDVRFFYNRFSSSFLETTGGVALKLFLKDIVGEAIKLGRKIERAEIRVTLPLEAPTELGR